MKLTEEQMAINRLLTGNTAHSCKADYIKLAIKALEKQVPMKPRIQQAYPQDLALCSQCDCGLRYNSKWKDSYCCKCGQKVDWGNVG